MSAHPSPAPPEVLERIEQRVPWPAVALIDHADTMREDTSGVKSAGTRRLAIDPDRVVVSAVAAAEPGSVKPHASPVLHAINYLLGELDVACLTTLRAFGGLQSYSGRNKEPDPVGHSTGSVGIAAIWGVGAPLRR